MYPNGVKIAVFAGLGNQLFQYAYAHKISEMTGRQIEFAIDNKPQGDRPYLLAPLVANCSHVRKVNQEEIREVPKQRFGIQLFKNRHLRFLLPMFNSSYFAQEKFPFQYSLEQFSKHKLNVGYFQNWRYVESVWENISSEINQVLAKQDLSMVSGISLGKTIVIHIRRGDLIPSAKTMGVIDVRYYEKAIANILRLEPNLDIICITDDVPNSIDIAEQLNAKVLLGPQALNEWEAIALMSKSKYVVASNSTFSWWGSYLCSKNGGSAILPHPWFRNWHQSIEQAFVFPGSTIEEAIFIEVL